MNPLSLNYLEHRSQINWLIGIDNQALVDQTDSLYRQLQDQVSSNPIPRILLIDPDPTNFLAGFLAACMAKYPVFLGNPNWTDHEQQQVLELIQPDVILIAGCWNDAMDFESGNNPHRQSPAQPARHAIHKLTPATIMIPTGGSSGQVRFAIHTWNTLMASVRGFQQHFGVDRIHSYCVLPLHHVSGLMQCLRSYTSQGQFAVQPYKHLLAGQPLDLDLAEFFISLVPTQLQRLLDCGDPTPTGASLTQWLKQSRAVLVGGAPIWQSLWAQAQHVRLPLAPTYGMTETASQVATLLPSEFLAGKTGSGRSLPHAQLTIHDPNGDPLPPNTIGTIAIQSPSLCLGYVECGGRSGECGVRSAEGGVRGAECGVRSAEGGVRSAEDGVRSAECGVRSAEDEQGRTHHSSPITHYPLPITHYPSPTDDIGFLDADGYLHVVGRNSSKIITGGENVFPAEVEAAILATGLVMDVCVLGMPDRHWGEAVTAVYMPRQPTITTPQLAAAIADRLSPYKQPKQWFAIAALPRNPQGKLNLGLVRQIAEAERLRSLMV